MSSTPRKRVHGYYRKDGTYVRGHYRSRPGTGGSPSRGSSSTGPGFGKILGLMLLLPIALGILNELMQGLG